MLGLLNRCLHFSDEWRIAEQDLNLQNRGQKGYGAVRNQAHRGSRGEGRGRLPLTSRTRREETREHFVGMWGRVAVLARVCTHARMFLED